MDSTENIDKLNQGIQSVDDMSEKISYLIWGAVHTTTRSFKSVSINVSTETNRIFVKVELRWPFEKKRFKKLQDSWLRIAEKRTTEFVPNGYKIMVYYGSK